MYTNNVDGTDIGTLLYNKSSGRWIDNDETYSLASSTRQEILKVQCATATRDTVFVATETLLKSRGTVLRRRDNAIMKLSDSLGSCGSMMYVAEKRQRVNGVLHIQYTFNRLSEMHAVTRQVFMRIQILI